MKAERCTAVSKAGNPCHAAAVPGDSRCAWHSEAWAEQRREWSKRGGEQRSHRARARKALGGSHDLRSVQERLVKALERVEEGTLEPARAQAMASLGRTLVAVIQAAELESRIRDLEQAAQQIGGTSA